MSVGRRPSIKWGSGGISTGSSSITTVTTGGSTSYKSFCNFYWHPGVFIKIDKPGDTIENVSDFGKGCVLTVNRSLRTLPPYGGSSGWLTTGTTGTTNESTYDTYTKLPAEGEIGSRQFNYPSGSSDVLNNYAPTNCQTPEDAQITKYKRQFAGNEPIRGRWFYTDKWVKFCHDYVAVDSIVEKGFYDSQSNALTIRKISHAKPMINARTLTVETIPEDSTVNFLTSGIVRMKSITVSAGTVVNYTVSHEDYITQTRSVEVINSATQTVVLYSDEITYTLTIQTGPENATVEFHTPGNVLGKSIVVGKDTVVEYTVSAPGYITQNNTYMVTSDKTLNINLQAESIATECTLTIRPTPSDSTVTFEGTGTVIGNTIVVLSGTPVTYTVSHNEYITQTSSLVVNSSTYIDVTLHTSAMEMAVLTIRPVPASATVTFDTGSVAGNSTTVFAGTTVVYTVSKTGYESQSSSITVTNDITIDITLQEKRYLLTVNTVPDTAIVTFNTPGGIVSGNTISVLQYTDVYYTVSATGYVTQSGDTIVDQDKSVTVTLEQAVYHIITINPIPGQATVTFPDTEGVISGNSITVLSGTTVYYTVSYPGYITQSTSTVADEDKTINVPLIANYVELTIAPNPSDAVVTFITEGTIVDTNTIRVIEGTDVSYSVYKVDYAPFNDTVTVNATQTVYAILTYQPYEENEVIFESSLPGTQNVEILIGGNYQLVAVGAGGGAANGFAYGPQQQGYFNGGAGGGSGGYSSLIQSLQACTIPVTVGSLGSTSIGTEAGAVQQGTAGTASTIGQYLTANGGDGGYVHVGGNPQVAGGTGGFGTTTSGLTGYVTNVPTRTSAYRGGPCTGAPSVYETYGAGSGVSVNTTTHALSTNPGTNGYVKIVYLGATNPENVYVTIDPTPSYASVLFHNTTGTITGNTITVVYGTVVSYTVSAVGYYDKTQNVTATYNRTMQVVLDARPPQYTLTIQPGPESATVQFDTEGTVVDNSITVDAGVDVYYTVSATGYITQTGHTVVNQNQTVPVILEAEQIITPDPILTINPTPSTATVTFDQVTGGQVSGNQIAVPTGSSVTYHVTATGYTPVNDTVTVTADTTLSVTLQPVVVVLTVETVPTSATVTFITAGTVSGNSIAVNQYTNVEYTVSASGYAPKTESYVASSTMTIQVTLTPIYVNLTISPTPNDATVTFSTGSVSGNMVTVLQGTAVTYTVSRTGYVTTSQTVTVMNSQTIEVSLEATLVTLTVNPTLGSAATVTFNTSGAQTGNSLTVPYNTNVSYTLTASGHETRTLNEVVTSTHTVTPQMRLSLVNPMLSTSAAVSNNISSGGQAITGGNYTYTRAGRTYTFTVNVNARGVVQSITNIQNTGGTISSTTVPHSLVPTGGWIWLEVWD